MCRSRRRPVRVAATLAAATFCAAVGAAAQDAAAPPAQAAAIEQAQAAKASQLHPYEPGKAEEVLDRIEGMLVGGSRTVHPFFDSAYAGGGFTVGAGYATYVSAYSLLDVRASVTVKGYTRAEAALLVPRLFDRRGTLTLLGGWREATQVGFYGIGLTNTSSDDRANYSFEQPYAAAALDLRPARNAIVLAVGAETSRWAQSGGSGSAPSVDEVYTPATLQGLGSHPVYLHTNAGIGLDWRPSAGYARRGGAYTIAIHDFHETEGRWGFRRADYEAIQHIPVLRDAWVISLHARAQIASAAGDQAIPFFMLPALGGGSSLRGFASWRFRDANSLLLQAEWRVLVNRYLDLALFGDSGRVSARPGDLADGPFKNDVGAGVRFHGPLATPLRIEVAKSNEGLSLVFSSKAAF
jgi:hypothetical protein